MPRKQKFNKKTAITYSLVQRSLEPIDENEAGGKKQETQEEFLRRKEEEHTYGIFYNDDYDYMQHLREVGSSRSVLHQAPADLIIVKDLAREQKDISGERYADVLPVKEEKPRLDTEDVVDLEHAMEEDFDLNDLNNILDDDFVLQAETRPEDEMRDDAEDYPGLEEEYADPSRLLNKDHMVGTWINHQDPEKEPLDVGNAKGRDAAERKSTVSLIRDWVHENTNDNMRIDDDDEFAAEEKRSRFTNYSMTSSVIRRNEALRFLDDRFEQMFQQDYEEDQIGALDTEDLEGPGVNDSTLLQAALKENGCEEEESSEEEEMQEADPVALRFVYDDEERMEKVIITRPDDKFDCQSIISLQSNKTYQPRVIEAPRRVKPIVLDPRSGFPRDPSANSESEDSLSDEGSDILSIISSLSKRPKDESPEEKKLRKHTLKELRRERRVEKKINKLAFREEKLRQERDVADVQKRLKTIAMA